MPQLIRLGLLLAALLVVVWIVAVHGVRGIAVVALVALAATAPRTRAWRVGESFLVRLTGSRQRAAALVMAVVVGCLIAVNVYEFVH